MEETFKEQKVRKIDVIDDLKNEINKDLIPPFYRKEGNGEVSTEDSKLMQEYVQRFHVISDRIHLKETDCEEDTLNELDEEIQELTNLKNDMEALLK